LSTGFSLFAGAVRQRGMSTWSYVLFLFVVVLVGLEVALRAFDPIGIVYLYDVRRYFKTMLIADERYAYIHAPNTEGSLNGEAVRFNSIGLRGGEVPANKAPGTFRLLVLGDSVVLGWGVAEETMFVRRLQRKFDAARQPVEVIAAGVGSWNTRTELEWLRHVGVDLKPDALLLLIVPNDTDPKRDGGFTEVPRDELFPPRAKQDRSVLANWAEDFWRSAARISYVAAYLKYFWVEHWLKNDAADLLDEQAPQWRDAQLALDGIIELTRRRGIQLIVYLHGSADMIATDPVLRLYDRHLKARGVRVHTLPDELFERRDLHISMVDSHLNAEGNRVLAEALFEELAPLLQKPAQ
jgi:lysophospholipase L1-like esterase